MQNQEMLLSSCKQAIEYLVIGKAEQASPLPDSLACSKEEMEFITAFNQFLTKYQEGMGFVNQFCAGQVNVDPPVRNHLIGPMKQLQAQLRHLIWQTQQLAAGDLSQRVEFMGDFSDSFNTLIASLREKEILQEKLRKSEEFYRTILSISPDGITIVDMNGIQKFISPKGLKMFGFESDEELIGKNFIELVAPEYREKAIYLIGELMLGHYTGVEQYQVTKKTGEVFWVEANAEVLRTPTGDLEAIMFIYRDTTQKKMLEQQLHEYSRMMEQQARTDRMTGLLNRTEGLEVLTTEVMRAARRNMPLTVSFVDLDNLKVINDRFGHAEGDKMILSLTSCLQKYTRGTDTVARMGGDEFLIIFPDCEAQQAQHVLQRIKTCTESEDKLLTPFFFSYGLATLHPDRPITPDQLIHLADERMYIQKKEKKARETPSFAPEDHAESHAD